MVPLVASVAAGLLLAAYIRRETHTLGISRVEVPIDDLPEPLSGFGIGLLSDLHGRYGNFGGQVIGELRKARVDLIAVVGDFVHRKPAEIERVGPLIRELKTVAPTYAVSGNHDHWAGWPPIADHLDQAGATILDNRHVCVEKAGKTLVLAGVADPYTGRDRLDQALPAVPPGPIVLLAHAPTWFAGPVRRKPYDPLPLLSRVALTLTGHTHGGQVKLPFLGVVSTASGRLFPRSYIQGLSREGDGWLYITRGLGQGGPLPLRVGSRPEVAIITLRSPAARQRAAVEAPS
jgi:predicted MPP superfamily phosphohydrolase